MERLLEKSTLYCFKENREIKHSLSDAEIKKYAMIIKKDHPGWFETVNFKFPLDLDGAKCGLRQPEALDKIIRHITDKKKDKRETIHIYIEKSYAFNSNSKD